LTLWALAFTAFSLHAATFHVTAFGAKGDGKTENREAIGIELNDIDVGNMAEDRRPAFVLDSVQAIAFEHCRAAKAGGVPTFVMMNAKGVGAHQCAGLADFQAGSVARKEM
jgi:hypothetical protein